MSLLDSGKREKLLTPASGIVSMEEREKKKKEKER